MGKLYELTEAYVDLLAMLEDCTTDAERDAIFEEINALDGAISDKGEAYARMMRNAQADADAYDKEIKRLQAKKKAADNMVERLKNNIIFAMGIAGATELNTSIGKWRIQQNPPSVKVLDEGMVPDEFFVEQPKKLMNSLIMAHWKETGEIPDGCDIVRTDGVRFR